MLARTIAALGLACALAGHAEARQFHVKQNYACDSDGRCRAATMAVTPPKRSATRKTAQAGQRTTTVRAAAQSVQVRASISTAPDGLPWRVPLALPAAKVRSVFGAEALVAGRLRHVFQAYLVDLEAHGARIKDIGGIRRGACAPPRHKHPCGMALDVCQIARDRVREDCRLPGRWSLIAIAARHGLTEGGEWCSGDRGHAEAGHGAGPCVARRRAAAHWATAARP